LLHHDDLEVESVGQFGVETECRRLSGVSRAPSAAQVERGEVAQFRRSLGLAHIIDVHTHYMPEPVLSKVWAQFDGAGALVGRLWPNALRALERTGLGAAWLRAVCHDNAARLFAL
jgi:hypothetical protein